MLADGGVYDNLGLETAWKSSKTILVSNGGGALGCRRIRSTIGSARPNRVLNIIYSQVVILRTRSIVELFESGSS